ncbi:hypothetical protein Tco_1511307, partial [Tanacetum coccineum]
LAMSSDNASSAVTYMSISSYSNGPSWGISLVNADELLEMDPYEEVKDQPFLDDSSPTAKSPGYIADSDSMKEDYIDYPDEPEDDDEDPEEDNDEDTEEDPSEEHKPEDDDEDPKENPSEEHEPEDEDTKEEEPSEGSDETEPFEEDKTDVTPPPPRHRKARISVRPQTPMAASTQALIDAFAAGSPPFPLPPTSPTYDQAPLGHRAAMIHMRDDIPEEDMLLQRRFVLTAPPPGYNVAESSAAARPPRGQYDFVDTVETGQGLIRSPGHGARTIARAADKAEDDGYVRRRESEDFYTQLHDAQTDRGDIRLEIDVNRALLARLETLETYMSHMEWQRQAAEDRAVRQMMCTHVLEDRAQIDTVEDTGSSC